MSLKLSKSQKNFFVSLLILCSISFLGAFSFFILEIGNFYANFILFFIFQFVILSFILNIIKTKIKNKTREKELEKLENLSTILECAYCKKKNIVIFNPNETERIEFECDHCKKKNLVTIQFLVSQIFEPMEIPKVIGVPSKNS
jgi:hypothetical protein